MAERAGNAVRVYVEIGRKKTFAGALDWPGWIRAGKSVDGALEALADYRGRYGMVASHAGLQVPTADFEVVEELPGNGSTDFGAPDRIATADYEPWVDEAERERHVALLEASWRLLDEVAVTASPELRKGPRGGGRDRDEVVAHVLGAHVGYARRIGVRDRVPDLADPVAVAAHRQRVIDTVRQPPASVPGKPWPVRYALRRMAWHLLDHAWEMEDKTLA